MDLAEQLKEAPLFKAVSLEDLEALVAMMEPQSVAKGTHLFEKGDTGDSMYIVVSGLVRIYSQDEQGEEFTLTNYGPGKVFGDFSLLDQQPRSASALAIEPLELLVLSRQGFLDFLPGHTAIGMAIINHLTDRLRYITIYLNKVTTFGQRLSQGQFDEALEEISGSNTGDTEIDGLITAFMQMVRHVQAREENLTIPE